MRLGINYVDSQALLVVILKTNEFQVPVKFRIQKTKPAIRLTKQK